MNIKLIIENGIFYICGNFVVIIINYLFLSKIYLLFIYNKYKNIKNFILFIYLIN